MHKRPSPCVAFESLEGRSLMSSTISGTVFNDADADGHRSNTEVGLKNVRVYIDSNLDGKYEAGEPTTLTSASGTYSFTGLAAGVFRVEVVTPSGYRQTSPALDYYDVASEGEESHVANDFGFTTTAIVRGTVFSDTNHDGVKDGTEQGLADVLVFIDKNHNGKLDPGEKSRYTDASGDYRFRGLTAGTYIIRVAPAAGEGVSTSGFVRLKLTDAESLSNRNFGILT